MLGNIQTQLDIHPYFSPEPETRQGSHRLCRWRWFGPGIGMSGLCQWTPAQKRMNTCTKKLAKIETLKCTHWVVTNKIGQTSTLNYLHLLRLAAVILGRVGFSNRFEKDPVILHPSEHLRHQGLGQMYGLQVHACHTRKNIAFLRKYSRRVAFSPSLIA